MAIQTNQDNDLTTGQLVLFGVAAIMLVFFAWTYIN
jgi:hypothetical protein